MQHPLCQCVINSRFERVFGKEGFLKFKQLLHNYKDRYSPSSVSEELLSLLCDEISRIGSSLNKSYYVLTNNQIWVILKHFKTLLGTLVCSFSKFVMFVLMLRYHLTHRKGLKL